MRQGKFSPIDNFLGKQLENRLIKKFLDCVISSFGLKKKENFRLHFK